MDDDLLDEIILSSDTIYNNTTQQPIVDKNYTVNTGDIELPSFPGLLGTSDDESDERDDINIVRVVTPGIIADIEDSILDIPFIYSSPTMVTKTFTYGINSEFDYELKESNFEYAKFCHFCGIHVSQHFSCRHSFVGIDATKVCKLCKKFYFQHFPGSEYLPPGIDFHYFRHS